MQQGVSVNNQGAHQAKEVSKATIRIVGTFTQPGQSSLAEHSLRLSAMSVGKIAPDKKPLYIKFELDGVRLDNLPAISPKSIPEQRDWTFPLCVLNPLLTCYPGSKTD